MRRSRSGSTRRAFAPPLFVAASSGRTGSGAHQDLHPFAASACRLPDYLCVGRGEDSPRGRIVLIAPGPGDRAGDKGPNGQALRPLPGVHGLVTVRPGSQYDTLPRADAAGARAALPAPRPTGLPALSFRGLHAPRPPPGPGAAAGGGRRLGLQRRLQPEAGPVSRLAAMAGSPPMSSCRPCGAECPNGLRPGPTPVAPDAAPFGLLQVAWPGCSSPVPTRQPCGALRRRVRRGRPPGGRLLRRAAHALRRRAEARDRARPPSPAFDRLREGGR